MEIATFAAGCFWHVEEVFRLLPGVIATEVGYMGGTTEHPTYEQVCSQLTGHAEAVQITFDPATISYTELLQQFWLCHDPTQLNRQGPDFGTNYRSAIFCHSTEQLVAARASLRSEEESGRHRSRIVTQIMPAGSFWRAEEYHQHYLAKKGGAGCRL
jgi:peptide-methionine (S)-S-oxide reductase